MALDLQTLEGAVAAQEPSLQYLLLLFHTQKVPSKGNQASSSLFLFRGVRGRTGKCGCEKEADTMVLNCFHPVGSVAFSIFLKGKQ